MQSCCFPYQTFCFFDVVVKLDVKVPIAYTPSLAESETLLVRGSLLIKTLRCWRGCPWFITGEWVLFVKSALELKRNVCVVFYFTL